MSREYSVSRLVASFNYSETKHIVPPPRCEESLDETYYSRHVVASNARILTEYRSPISFIGIVGTNDDAKNAKRERESENERGSSATIETIY